MRIQINLKTLNDSKLSFNYQYCLSSAIYNALEKANSAVSKKLHVIPLSKPFTFSFLHFDNYHTNATSLILKKDTHASFVFSSMFDSLINLLSQGLISKKQLRIKHTKFELLNFKIIPDINLAQHSYFKCLSPLCIFDENRQYSDVTDPDLPNKILQNLVKKYNIFNNKTINVSFFKFKLDANYIKNHQSKCSKLLKIKEGSPEETHIKGIFCPFYLDTSIELKQIAYHAGIGKNTAMGMGCISAI